MNELEITSLIAKCKAQIESRPGYNYSETVLAEIITCGSIADRTIIMTTADYYAVYYQDRIAKVRMSDLVEIESQPMTPGNHLMALRMYAIRESEQAVKGARTQKHSI